MSMDSDECCPLFDPRPWDMKEFSWDGKKFVKDKVSTVMHVPLNFGGAMRSLNGAVEKAGGEIPEWLCLSEHTSKWSMDLYLAVDRDIPGAENVTFSGKFLSKVYEGPYKDMGTWTKDFKRYVAEKDHIIKRMYTWYTTCPKCARKHGKNYVVFMAKI